MPYFFECDYCGAQHSLGNPRHDFPETPDRSCEDCGQDGCRDCLPNELCESCQERHAEEDRAEEAKDALGG